MATVGDLYQEFCFDLLEDSGLSLGVVTLQQYIAALNDTLRDFCQRTALIKTIYTQEIDLAVAQYAIPDNQMEVEQAYVAGRWVEPSTVNDLYSANRFWRSKPGAPAAWHVDGLAPKTIELAPAPDYNGQTIPGANFPAGPNAQYGDWAVTIGGSSVPASQHRGLTTIGGQLPTALTYTGVPATDLAQAIPLVPDEWAIGYLPFGVLARLLAADGEQRDPERAKFARDQYEEGVAAARALTSELEERLS